MQKGKRQEPMRSKSGSVYKGNGISKEADVFLSNIKELFSIKLYIILAFCIIYLTGQRGH